MNDEPQKIMEEETYPLEETDSVVLLEMLRVALRPRNDDDTRSADLDEINRLVITEALVTRGWRPSIYELGALDGHQWFDLSGDESATKTVHVVPDVETYEPNGSRPFEGPTIPEGVRVYLWSCMDPANDVHPEADDY